jgi:hypothetical protein
MRNGIMPMMIVIAVSLFLPGEVFSRAAGAMSPTTSI